MFTWNNQLNAEEQTQRSLEQVGAQKSTNTNIPVGEPLHDPKVPQPPPAGTRRHLRTGEQRGASPRRPAAAHHPRARRADSGSCTPAAAVELWVNRRLSVAGKGAFLFFPPV